MAPAPEAETRQATPPVPELEPAPISRTVVPPGKPTAAAEVVSLPPPSTTRSGDYSLARQLGLSVQRIVIDAGHGGHDPGAQGNGIVEKNLVLDVALRLKKLLDAQPGIEAVLTRDTDEFIPLEERTAIANRANADLFLSIHANASRRKEARGLETYFLNFATNPEAEAVAARENAAASQSMGQLPEILKAIALNAKLAESRELATMVQTSMVRRLKAQSSAVRDLGVKQAPFVVLIGAEMPSVLAEISFVTNRADASLLKQNATKQRIAQALFDGILKYQTSLKKITTVAAKGSRQ
jgi:N-acetylmuramoyl-L-alanine amidase